MTNCKLPVIGGIITAVGLPGHIGSVVLPGDTVGKILSYMLGCFSALMLLMGVAILSYGLGKGARRKKRVRRRKQLGLE